MSTSNKLVDLIREIVKDELLNKDDATICLVQSVNADGTLNIQLLSDIETILENIPNNSAYTFESGDYAVLYKLDNNLANAFVMSKVTDVPPELVKNTYIMGGGSSSGGGGPIPSNYVSDVTVNENSVVENKVAKLHSTSSVTSGSPAFLTSGGAYTALANYAKTSDIPTSINNMSGGSLTSPLVVYGGDGANGDVAKIALDHTRFGQITDEGTRTIFGFLPNSAQTLTVGSTNYGLNLRGNTTRPQYKGSDLALYSDIPTVNNATLTIQKNSSTVQTFTANQATDVVANILVPTKTSDLTNDGNGILYEGEIDPFTTKSFVNSSIATNTANFIGTFASVSALNSYSGTVTNNDYAFVVNSTIYYDTTTNPPTEDFPTKAALDEYDKTLLTNFDYAWVVNGTKFDLYRFDILDQTWDSRATSIDKDDNLLNTAYNRYKATVASNVVTWDYEYTLNNSSFTAAQWAAINSGVASGNWVTTNTTQTISSTKRFSDSIHLDVKSSIWTGNIFGKNSSNNTVSYIGFNTNGQIGFQSNQTGNDTCAYTFRIGTTNRLRISDTVLRPESTDTNDLGTSAIQWKNIFGRTIYQNGNTVANLLSITSATYPVYSANSTYAVNDTVSRYGNIYKCNTAIPTGETWNASHWTQIYIIDDYMPKSGGTFTGAVTVNGDFYGQTIYQNGSQVANASDIIVKSGTTAVTTTTTINSSVPAIFTLNRTSSNGGAFIDYFGNNQTATGWRVGCGGGLDYEIYSQSSGTNTKVSWIKSNGNLYASGAIYQNSNKQVANKEDIKDATITIQKNSVTVQTFTVNQATDVVADISVPTKTSDLTNDGNGELYEGESDPFTTKSFVNSSIATNTANFIGTFQDVQSLKSYSGTVTNNDYAFVVNSVVQYNGGDFPDLATLNAYSKTLLTNFDYAWVENDPNFDLYRFDIARGTNGEWVLKVENTDKASVTLNTAYNRYKATVASNVVTWEYEYTLNNSSFTAAQWAAINSGVTQGNWVTTGTAQTISGEKTFTEDVKINGKTIIFTGDCKLKSSNAIYRFGDSSDPSGVMVAANASGVRFLRPGQNNIMDLGTTAVKWKNLYLSSTAYIPTINNGSNISVPTTSGTLALTSDIPDMTNVAYKNIDNNFSAKETFTGGIKVTGRYADGGDDEGIIVGTATNGYAGVCCGSPSGRRAVFYLKPLDTSGNSVNSVWRYNNGSASYDIAHPEKSGTIALISDVNGDVSATASSVAQRDTNANLNATSFSMCASGTSTSNAKMQYNSTNESIEFIFS